MIITCPSCATRYRVPVAAFSPDDGRRVRCQSCGFKWFAVPEEEKSESLLEDAEPEDFDTDPSESDDGSRSEEESEPDYDQAAEDFTAHLAEAARLEANLAAMSGRKVPRRRSLGIGRIARRPVRSARSGKSNFQGWAAVVAFIALCLFAGFEYRETVVRAVPRASNIYAAAGLPVNVVGVDFMNIRVAREFENGLPVLAVEGEVVNVSETVVSVPRVRLGLRDADAQEIYHWTVPVANEPLLPNNRVRFATKLASPPTHAKDVMIRFSDTAMRVGSL